MNKFIFLLTGLVVMMSSCHYVNSRHISGNGTMGTEQRNLTALAVLRPMGLLISLHPRAIINIKIETDQKPVAVC